MDLRRIDLNLLVVFEAIYQSRNLTAAGEALGLSQPAMSHALSRLRSAFNEPLFVRLPRGLEPTPFAQGLSSAISQGLGVLRGALGKAEFEPATASRTFKVVMTDIGEYWFVPRLSRHFQAEAPGVSLQALQVPGKELGEAMAKGDIDLSLGFITGLGAGFYQQRLFTDSYVCMVSKQHSTIRSSLTLEQYLQAAHVLISSEGMAHGELIERGLLKRNPHVRLALRVNRFLAVPAVVADSDLVATVPRNLGESFRPLLNVRLLPVPFDLPSFEVKQFWHERYHADPGNQWLRRTVANLFAVPAARSKRRHPGNC